MTHAPPNTDRRELHSDGDDYDLHADLGSFAGEPKPRKVSRAAHWLAAPVTLRENGIPEDDGHVQPGITTNVAEGDVPAFKALTGHDNVHSLHRHLFGAMAGRVTGHYDAAVNNPHGAEHVRFEGHVLDPEQQHPIGDITRHIFGATTDTDGQPQPRSMDNAGLTLHNPEQGHGVGSQLYAQQEKYARDTGIKAIHLHASDEVGPYAWARQGYDFAPNQSEADSHWDKSKMGATPLEHYKAALHETNRDLAARGVISQGDSSIYGGYIDKLKHSWDVANFDSGVQFPIASQGGKYGHAGKYVMTDPKYRIDYMAKKDITPDASSPGEQQAARQHALAEQAKTL